MKIVKVVESSQGIRWGHVIETTVQWIRYYDIHSHDIVTYYKYSTYGRILEERRRATIEDIERVGKGEPVDWFSASGSVK